MTDAELTELDLAVARVLGLDPWVAEGGIVCVGSGADAPYSPTRNWSDCGPLVERFRLSLDPEDDFSWSCTYAWTTAGEAKACFGPTPQVAISRAIVASGG